MGIVPDATDGEVAAALHVMEAVRACIKADEKIMLPARVGPGDATLFVTNPFGGVLGPYHYQFEGEEDLLHLIVVRADGKELTPEDSRTVAGVLFEGVSGALIWIKPGTFSQHFYVGHDDLL